MAKPDWGMLQQQFLAEHAITGISPKEWCELKELNYATARRYIKISSAQNAQKTAHKKLRTAQKKECAIVIYPLRIVMDQVMRMMMKTPLVCAITG